MEWKYGDAGDRFPTETGDVWRCGPHKLVCCDIQSTLAEEMVPDKVDVIYTDPPYNRGLLKGFYTKAQIEPPPTPFPAFLNALLGYFQRAKVVYCEAGKDASETFVPAIIAAGGKITDVIPITYMRKHSAVLIRAEFGNPLWQTDFDMVQGMEGADDEKTPRMALRAEEGAKHVADLCTGRGLTAKAAHKESKVFTGVELNGRRLACVVDWFAQQGVEVYK